MERKYFYGNRSEEKVFICFSSKSNYELETFAFHWSAGCVMKANSPRLLPHERFTLLRNNGWVNATMRFWLTYPHKFYDYVLNESSLRVKISVLMSSKSTLWCQHVEWYSFNLSSHRQRNGIEFRDKSLSYHVDWIKFPLNPITWIFYPFRFRFY